MPPKRYGTLHCEPCSLTAVDLNAGNVLCCKVMLKLKSVVRDGELVINCIKEHTKRSRPFA